MEVKLTCCIDLVNTASRRSRTEEAGRSSPGHHSGQSSRHNRQEVPSRISAVEEMGSSRDEISAYPIQEAHFALYLQHLSETSRSKASVEEAVNAVA